MADEIELPEGCTETGRITIVRYFDPTVETGEDIVVEPSDRLSPLVALGMCELAKIVLMDSIDDDD